MRKARKVKQFGRKPKTPGWSDFQVAILEMQPGDTLVLRTDLVLTRAQVDEFRKRLDESFPGIRSVILTHGMSLAVVRDKAA